MDIFKLHTWNTEPVPVTKNDFEEKTGKKSPYYIRDSKGIHCRGVCYYCNNPVQIRGLYKKDGDGRMYAAHNGKSVKDLADWDQEEYIYCPGSVKGKRLPKETRRKDLTEKERLIYNTLREHIAEAYAAMKKLYGLYISPDEYLQYLQSYHDTEGWRYPYSTTGNIPYMILYLGENPYAYGRLVRTGTDFEKKLEKQADIVVKDTGHGYKKIMTQAGRFMKLSLMVWDHEYSTDGADHLKESIGLRLSEDTGDEAASEYRTLAEAKLPVDEEYFGNLINSGRADRIRDDNKELVEEGMKILPPLR